MKGKTKKIKSIYWELRKSLGPEFKSHEIIGLASAIVRNLDNPKIDYSFKDYSGPKSLHERELTDIFSEAEWQVLSQEQERLNVFYDDCADYFASPRSPYPTTLSYQELLG